jgi:hypothetical protein
MSESKRRCFVVMGFGIKTDYINGRKLDLNKSYRLLIKPVVEEKGLDCVRADEITHSGSIDVQMYRELSRADLIYARRTWKRVLYLCDRDWKLINEKEKNDQDLINDGTKDGQELQEYYNAQKYWILVNRAESSFGLGDFDTYKLSIQESQNVNFHPWQLESFTEQIGKLKAELTKVGHLIQPKWEFIE